MSLDLRLRAQQPLKNIEMRGARCALEFSLSSSKSPFARWHDIVLDEIESCLRETAEEVRQETRVDAAPRLYARAKHLIETICRAMSANPTSTARPWVDELRTVFEDAEIKLLGAGGQSLAWQPIETAPKDGTAVLVYDDGAMTVSGYADGAFWDCGLRMKPGPTHWMPLPSPPKEQ